MLRSARLCIAFSMVAGLGLSLSAGAQEKKSDVAAAAQQDRIDIGQNLDSWYKVLQNDAPVGYVHEVLSRAPAGSPWRYSYTADAEVEAMVKDPKDPRKEVASTESLHISAKLDDTYAPISMERMDVRDDFQMSSAVVSDDSGKKIDLVIGSTDRRSFPVGADEEVHYSRFLMFISLRQNGKLSRAGTQRAMLFAPREDDKAPLAEVQLEVHEMVKREYLGKKEVAVTRVSYLKPPPAVSRDAELLETYVDKFGRVVEELTRGGMKRILVKDEVEAVGSHERIRPGARRDPFLKNLAMNHRSKGGEAEGKVAPPVVDPNNIAATIKELEKLVEELKKAKDEKREDDGQKIYERILDVHAAVRAQNLVKPLPPEQITRVEDLRKQAEEIWGGVERLMKETQDLYVRVLQAFDKDECGEMEQSIAKIKKALDRKELQDRKELIQISKWISELEPLVGKCRTRQELGRKRLVLTGTLIHEDVQMVPVEVSVTVLGHTVGGTHTVRFIKPNRIAVINEKMYRVGDTVEGEGVRVEKVWAFGVQVSLREETREVGIRQTK